MPRSRAQSPTARLLAGLAVILSATAVYSGYAIAQLHGLEQLQTGIIDRNRADSLLLLRIQNNLNSLGLAMRDMLDGSEPYPLTAWQAQFRRIRNDLEDALAREARNSAMDSAPGSGTTSRHRSTSFGTRSIGVFALARSGDEAEARTLIRLSLQARQEALTSAVARLLVQNNETEQQAGERVRTIYARVERNSYIFVAAVLILILLTSLYVVSYNRRVFREIDGAFGAPQRTRPTGDFDAGEYAGRDFARTPRRFRPDPHRHRQHAAARRPPHVAGSGCAAARSSRGPGDRAVDSRQSAVPVPCAASRDSG